MRITYPTAIVLFAVSRGVSHGFDIMDATGLPSGSVYPALRRLEARGLVTSSWEKDLQARKASRPRRRNYQVTALGRQELANAQAKFHAVSRLFAKRARI